MSGPFGATVSASQEALAQTCDGMMALELALQLYDELDALYDTCFRDATTGQGAGPSRGGGACVGRLSHVNACAATNWPAEPACCARIAHARIVATGGAAAPCSHADVDHFVWRPTVW